MKLSRLRLRDYRCFESLDIDFHPQLTVLLAPNGVGKTSLLDAIAIAYGPFVGAFDEAVGTHFDASDIRQFATRDTASNEMEHAVQGVRMEAEGHIPGSVHDVLLDGHSSKWRRSLASARTKTTIKHAKELSDYGKRLQTAVRTPGEAVLLPLIAYYGTGRLWQQKNRKRQVGVLQRTSRTVGYTDCLDPASSYKSFVEWFRYWSLSANEFRYKAAKSGMKQVRSEFDDYIESVATAVDRCTASAGWHGIEYSLAKEALVSHHPEFGQLPVASLSDGIRNMIGMVADIAFRATKLNGQLGAEAARTTPGIVLIDEVDMHLHPEWQQAVIPSLTEAFPHIQFIVTTHSPQVLSTVASESVRMIRNERDPESGKTRTTVETPQWQTRGIASTDLLARIMDVNPVPDVPEAQWVNQYQALIQQNLHESEHGIALRAQLESHFGSEHPVLLDCERLIRLQGFKQRLPKPMSQG